MVPNILLFLQSERLNKANNYFLIMMAVEYYINIIEINTHLLNHLGKIDFNANYLFILNVNYHYNCNYITDVRRSNFPRKILDSSANECWQTCTN